MPHTLSDHNYDSLWIECGVDQMASDSWKLGVRLAWGHVQVLS